MTWFKSFLFSIAPTLIKLRLIKVEFKPNMATVKQVLLEAEENAGDGTPRVLHVTFGLSWA